MTYQHPDLPEKFDKLREALEWASGCEVVWLLQDDGGRVREPNEVWGELQIFSMSNLGTDDVIYTESGDPDNPRQDVVVGYRLINFQLRFRSRNNEHANSSWYAASKTQTRLNSPYSRTAFLEPLCMGLASHVSITEVLGGVTFDQRIEGATIVEFSITTAVTDIDAAAIGSWIEAVEVTSRMKDVIGDDLPASLQWDEELIT